MRYGFLMLALTAGIQFLWTCAVDEGGLVSRCAGSFFLFNVFVEESREGLLLEVFFVEEVGIGVDRFCESISCTIGLLVRFDDLVFMCSAGVVEFFKFSVFVVLVSRSHE